MRIKWGFAMLIGQLLSFLKESAFCSTKLVKKPFYLIILFTIFMVNMIIVELLLALSLFNFLQDQFAFTVSICSLYTALAFLIQIILTLIIMSYLLNKNVQKNVVNSTRDSLVAFMKGFNRL